MMEKRREVEKNKRKVGKEEDQNKRNETVIKEDSGYKSSFC